MGLLKENRDHGLRVLSITAAAADNLWLDAAKERELLHSIASAGWNGETSPYLNMNKTAGPTYAFVIGRSGGILWAGNHAKDNEEFLEAVRLALAEPPTPALPATLGEELEDAVRAYVERDFQKAESAATKVARKLGKKKDEASLATAAQAEALSGLVAEHLATLSAPFINEGEGEFTSEGIAILYRAIVADFPKSEQRKLADKWIEVEDPLREEVRAQLAWLELRDERPPLFTTRFEKDEKRYAKKLQSYLKKNPDGFGAETVQGWLDARAANKP